MRAVPFFSACLLLLAASVASAQVDEERLRLMHETITYTDVIDAFDGEDRFDLNVRLEYERLRERGAIFRERSAADGVRKQVKVADHERELSRLSLGIDVGLLRDLMASLRMPLVLSDARALKLPGGRDEAQVATQLAGSVPGTPLFAPGFESPTRAGLDYIAVGAAYGVLNQMRKPWQPTWTVRIEGRRPLGRILQPCLSGKICGTTSNEDRDGDGLLDGTRDASQRPGSSRGMSALSLETRFSRRYRYAEPYAGLGLLVEWPSTARDTFRSASATDARPGVQSSAVLGTALVAWENRGTFQRIAIDMRLEATHVGEGYDYGALFDALGSSSDPELARARYEGVRGAVPGSTVPPCSNEAQLNCGVGQRSEFTGITLIAPHLQYGGRLAIEVQAARYVRFIVGSSLHVVTPHALTGVSACRRGSSTSQQLGDDGSVCAGAVEPRHRSVIDGGGQRFFMREQLLLGVFAQATAMF